MSDRAVMTADEMERAVRRLAADIVARHGDPADDLAIVGIQRRGAVLARRIAAAIGELRSDAAGAPVPAPPVGALDIALYRDDLTELALQPIVRPTELPFDVTDRTIVLVDDVLFTGRTIRAALDALGDFGRSRAIRLAVLVDRGHRELPIRADHVGRNLPTSRDERVYVHVREIDGRDDVELGRPVRPSEAVAGGAPRPG